MKIYHTETQADYDALMVELEAEGKTWWTGKKATENDIWNRFKSLTCVVVGKNINGFCYKEFYKEITPDVPIIKYKAKADEKMKFTKENVYKMVERYRLDFDYLIGDLKSDIFDLEYTPEKVVVPKYIAEWIQSYLNEGGTPIDVLGSLMSFHASFVDESVIRWFKKNSETMLKALTNGYTIEKEQLYYIPLPHLETSDGIQQVLSKRKNDTNYFASRPAETLKQRYTKDEIAQVPEIYKYYATLIEEEEE